jgi:hypothetical protein
VRIRWRAIAALGVVWSVVAVPVRAQSTETETGEADSDPEPGSRDSDSRTSDPPVGSRASESAPTAELEERELPNYDGRAARPPTTGEIALWVPRILLFPAYVVAEYLVRRPLAFLVSGAEEKEIPERVVNFFTFGPGDNVTLAPSFSFDFGFRPNIGLYFRYKELRREDFSLRAGAAFGGDDWISGSVGFRVAPKNGDTEFEISANAQRRPDWLFFGLGSNVSQDNRSRYDWVSYSGTASFKQRLVRQSSFSVGLSIIDRQFGDDIIGGDYSVEERAAAGQIELPPGYVGGYSIVQQTGELVLDSRRARPAPGSGFRFAAQYELGFDLQDGPQRNLWVTWATSLGAYLDLSQHQHVVSLTISLISAEALSGHVPFRELPNLSGSGPMRGYVNRYLAGSSGASILLRYDWPVWMWLDGTIQVAVGNVYDGRFAGLSPANTRLSAGIGLAAVNQRDHFFEFLIGFGTETFENGGQVESFRFLFGGTRTF